MNELSCENDTKSMLLDSAEQLFLNKGFEGVSVREITDAAGANIAAVNYHFNGKHNLYRAVLERRFTEITRHKIQLFNRLQQTTTSLTAKDIIETYVRSFFDDMISSPDQERLLQLIYREMGPDAIASDLVRFILITPIHDVMRNLLSVACPTLKEPQLTFCISSISGQVAHFIRSREVLKSVLAFESGPDFIEAVARHITEFSLRGIGSHAHV